MGTQNNAFIATGRTTEYMSAEVVAGKPMWSKEFRRFSDSFNVLSDLGSRRHDPVSEQTPQLSIRMGHEVLEA